MEQAHRPLISDRFPRSSRYHPDWIVGSSSGGAHSLWLTEWLAEALGLKPGMRVLDLGRGMAASEAKLDEPILSVPAEYAKYPLLRDE